jgi:CRP/FNR family transcriptional regulator, cyclic AMP receptor protein
VKDAIDSLSSVVPGGVASEGIGVRSSGGERRPDRPLRKDGAAILAQVPLFAGLSKRHLKRLAEHADEVDYGVKEVVVEADDPGGTFYIILRGEAKVTRKGKTIATLEPGDFFGEISLLDGGPRTANVVAQTPLVVVRIFKRSFDKMVAEEPGVAAKILEVVARRLRDAERRSLHR